ncbi:MAG: AAA family ATPase [Nitrososphaera sp.]
MSSKIEDIVHRAYSSKPKYSEIQPGVPEDYRQVKTLGDLLKINYKHASADAQLRGNLIRKLRAGEHPYPGIIGYDEDVVPAVNRAILSGHDMLLVGQIGQAKTKIAESIAKSLLSPIPVVRGTITNDIPTTIPEEHMTALLGGGDIVRTHPEFTVSNECEEIIKNDKLETKVDWISGEDRYKYILSTPDISVKDLVGQIDAIKIAKKGVELYSIESYSAGQLLQARHGILCIDELPVLDPRKQVALLSVLQEGKFTTGAYPVVFKPDVKIIATANPIDYTHSGKVIEPLFDRLKSHVDTHYPKTVEDEMLIVLQEARIPDAPVFVPEFMLRIIAMVTQGARAHQSVNHDKGVSVRMAVHSMEVLTGEAERTRAIHNNVIAIPRLSDIYAIRQSSKFELSEMEDTRENRDTVLYSIIENTLSQISLSYADNFQPELVSKVKSEFAKNKAFQVSQSSLGTGKQGDAHDYQSQLGKFPLLKQLVAEAAAAVRERQKQLVERARLYSIPTMSVSSDTELDGEFTASVTELVLEGLSHLQPPVLEKKENTYVPAI